MAIVSWRLSLADDSSLERGSSEMSVMTVFVTIDGKRYSATLNDNISSKAFVELLKNGPLSLNMKDYGGFEKVGRLETKLPESNQYYTTKLGDIMLYQGRELTIYYDKNSWSLTKIGEINDPLLKESLMQDAINAVFSLY